MLNLFTGSGVGPTILYLAISVFVGLLLGKIKIANVSLGITWVLFVGIALSAFGVSLNHDMLHIIKEFGLILFVVAVGLQVGPSFFRSFKKGGLAMNLMALVNVALGVTITVVIAKVANQDLADTVAPEDCKLPNMGYATVYPLTMFLRIFTAQLLVLLAV